MNYLSTVISIRESLCRAGVLAPDKDFISAVCDRFLSVNGLLDQSPKTDFGFTDELPDELFNHDADVIGQLYQAFITPDKDEAFKLLSKGKRLLDRDVPAATQIFTPKWIADYMAQNSVGRAVYDLGILTFDEFMRVRHNWPYYVDGAEENRINDGIRRDISSFRVMDPCVGAGRLLLSAFDVLMDVYGILGYDAASSARRILENNLYGIDIDENALSIARFTLLARAARFDASVISEGVKLNLLYTSDRVGSLRKDGPSLFGEAPRAPLSDEYDVVICNPPYMGGANMPEALAKYVLDNYPAGKADLFAAFIIRCRELTGSNGYTAIITQHTWMFLKSFSALRREILKCQIVNMLHLGSRAFDEIKGEVVKTVAFVTRKARSNGEFVVYRLVNGKTCADKQRDFLAGRGRFIVAPAMFRLLPDSIIAYWANEGMVKAFQASPLSATASPKQGMATGDNDRFLRMWHEVRRSDICFDASSRDGAALSGKRWFPYNKGGKFRKWYGNDDYVVDWSRDGYDIRNLRMNGKLKSRAQNLDCFFLPCVTWSKVSSNDIAFRYKPKGFAFDVSGTSMFADEETLYYLLAFCNSRVALEISRIVSPTMNFEVGQIASFPVIINNRRGEAAAMAKLCVGLSKRDWDSFETSWGFTIHPMLENRITGGDFDQSAYVETSLAIWRLKAQSLYDEVKAIEEKIDKFFSELYRIAESDETRDVSTISIRRIVDKSDVSDARKSRSMFVITAREAISSLISYAIGCAFERFDPFADGFGDGARIIPIVESSLFDCDALSILKRFLEKAYSGKTLDENLRFMALTLSNGLDATPSAIIRYFFRDFYQDHLKTYRNRPIYWLFDEGEFKALVYMFGFRDDTVKRVRDMLDESGIKDDLYRNALTRMIPTPSFDVNDGCLYNYYLFQNVRVDCNGIARDVNLLRKLDTRD